MRNYILKSSILNKIFMNKVKTLFLIVVVVALLFTYNKLNANAVTPPAGNGFTAQYYSTTDLSGVSQNRIDPTINFDWNSKTPYPNFKLDSFSARWTGQLTVPANGNWRIYTLSDDGVRVYIDGKLLINDWSIHPPKENSTKLYLAAGTSHSIVIEYYNKYVGASMKLSWSKRGVPKQIIPQSAIKPGLIVQPPSPTTTKVPPATTAPTTKPAPTTTPTTPTTQPTTTTTKVVSPTTQATTTTKGTTPTTDCNFNNSVGTVTHPINISSSGNQQVWVRVSHSAQATLQMSFNNAGCVTETLNPMGTDFMWMPINSAKPNLSAGAKTLTIGSSLAGLKLSTVLVFDSRIICTPTGDGSNCSNQVYVAPTIPTSPTTVKPTNPPTSQVTTTMPPMDHSGTCTPGVGVLGNMGPCIDNSKIPANGPSISSSVISTTNQPFKEVGGEPGAFRQKCDFSHMSYDDPIIFPGKQGAAHLHTFFGNAGTNYSTTPDSLLATGNSTCSGGTLNRSAYWVPAMIDTSIGRPIRPSDPRNQFMGDLEVYYKNGYQGIGYGDIQTFPKGFEMIAGNAPTATGETANSHVNYYCEDADQSQQSKRGTSIPVCNKGQILTMFIEFPQCWDGVNTTVPGARSHMAYGSAQGSTRGFYTDGCPKTHPIGLPVVEMFVRYYVSTPNTANWRLSSDNYTNGPGGYSGHADYMFAWDESIFPLVKKNCYNAQKDCLFGMGDGREPKFMRTILPWQPIYNN